MNKLGLQRVLEYGTENGLRVNLSPESENFDQISELVSKYKDAIDITLSLGNQDVLTDIDMLFASTSVEDLDELMKEVYKQWIEKRFKELSKEKFI